MPKTNMVLFFLSFITFGVGDTLTAVLMMNTKGVNAEFNGLFSYLYDSHGVMCFIAVKLMLVIMVLFAVYTLSKRGGYWLINGWLTALIVGGLMAMISNLSSTYDIFYVNPYHIITCYLIITLVFVYIGGYIDTYYTKNS